ncbi:hypothetical protein [Roseateles chitosanitabidus]|jgi:hypothetical protein|uniref:hypothetical protein n=1 Tax=Roseateles chitosanitabidus TaxID=65048 RepID=UPI00082F9EB5|nr:hypothetical protein [Roseateles chitosanitabidus]MBO9688986.1 hypothetical protein [Roseateles chitosanitabidus]
MNAQSNTVAANTVEQGLVELDLEDLQFVGGGTPKGTWLVGGDASALVATAADSMEPTPKGTW